MAITKATIARQMSNRIAYNKARRAAAARIKRAEKAGFIGAVLPEIPDHPPNKRDIDKLQRLTRKEIERRAVQAIDPRTGELVSKKELRKRNKKAAEDQRQKSRRLAKQRKEQKKPEKRQPKEPPTVSDAVLSWAEDLISSNLADSPRRANKARSVLQDKIARFGRDAVAQAFEDLGDTIKGYLEMVFIYEEDESRERDSYFLWRFIHALDGMMPDSVADLSEDEFMDFYGITEEE